MDLIDVASIYQRYLSAEIDREIAPEDQMYVSGPDWYFGIGQSGLMCILRALVAAELGSVRSILDLPSGHGRVTRHLRAAFPEAHLAVCDLDESGVEFCARQWNCEPIVSEPDLPSVELRGPYDVIWVGSLFTHVDEPRTRAWLRHLVNALGDVRRPRQHVARTMVAHRSGVLLFDDRRDELAEHRVRVPTDWLRVRALREL